MLSAFRRLFGKKHKTIVNANKKQKKTHLQVERLEDRAVPAAINFDNTSTYIQTFQSITDSNLAPPASSVAGTTMTEVSTLNGGGSVSGFYVYATTASGRWGRDNGGSSTGSFFGMRDGAGGLALGSEGSGTMQGFFGLVLQNTSGATINNISLTYDAVLNRAPSTTANAYPMSYRVSSTDVVASSSTADGTFNNSAGTWISGTGFITPTSGSGAPGSSNPINPFVEIGGASITQTLSGLGWGANQYLYIRWNETDESSSDSDAGIDNVTVAPVGNTDTSVTATNISPLTQNFGSAVTFTATVHASSGTVDPTGTVEFRDGGPSGTLLATATLISDAADGDAHYSVTTSSIPQGVYSNISAFYVHTGSFNNSSAAVGSTLTINGVATTTTLSLTTPINAGDAETFTGTVTGSGSPTGTVEIRNGSSTGTLLGSGTLSSGSFSIPVANLSAGIYSDVHAYYLGDTSNAASSSTPGQSLTVTADRNNFHTGDIAFTAFQADTLDKFAFVLLEDFNIGAVITFTDNAWTGSGLNTNEGNVTLTLTRNLPAGTQITYTETSPSTCTFTLADGSLAGTGTKTTNFSLNNSGDGLLAYNGTTAPSSNTDPAWVAGISTEAWLTTGTPNTETTYLPSALAGNFSFTWNSTSLDGGYYNGASPVTGRAIDQRNAIYNLASWPLVNNTTTTVPSPANFNVDNGWTEADFAFSVLSTSQAEGNSGSSTVTISVVRRGNQTNTATVSYNTAFTSNGGGTDADASDFTAVSPTALANFTAFQTSKTFTITISGDTSIENNETLKLQLSNPTVVSGGGTAALSSNYADAIHTIADDDSGAPTGVLLNEISINPPGTDGPNEYIELYNPTGSAVSLANVYYVYVDGDDGDGSGGVVKFVENLSAYTIAAHGFLTIRSGSTTLAFPSADASHVYVDDPLLSPAASNLENGAQTHMLVFSATAPVVGTDYDTNSDGVLEGALAPASITRLDSVGWTDNPGQNLVYGPTLPRYAANTPDAVTRFFGNAVANSIGGWYYGEMNGVANTDLKYNDTTMNGGAPLGASLTPGTDNYSLPTSGYLVFHSNGFQGVEGGVITVTVDRVGGSTGAISIDYATSVLTPGQAGANVRADLTDFTTTTGTLSWADGDSASKTFTIAITDDSTVEGAESFLITLSNPQNTTTPGVNVPGYVTRTANGVIAPSDTAATPATVVLNEVKVDAPGADNPGEYIELRGTPGATLSNIYVVSVEGDQGSIQLVGVAANAPTWSATTQLMTIKTVNLSNNLVSHGFTVGQQITLSGLTASNGQNLNGTFTILSTTSTSFSVYVPSDPGTITPSGATASETDALKMGTFDYVFDLKALNGGTDVTLGANGLLIIKASDGPTVSGADLAAGTKVLTDSRFDTLSGILENGTNSWLVLSSPTAPTQGQDYDSDNDGVLELSTINTDAVLLDGVSFSDGGSGDLTYGTVLTSRWTDDVPNEAATRLSTDATAFSNNAWRQGDLVHTDLGGATTTELRYDYANSNAPAGGVMTPGGANFSSTVAASGALRFTQSSYSTTEGGTITFTVERIDSFVGALDVTINLSATGDYNAPSVASLHWDDGEGGFKTFTVTTIDDAVVEGREDTTVTLTPTTGSPAFVAPYSATMSIYDNDGAAPTNVMLNEINVNPKGTDNPNEYFEIKGPTGGSLANLYFVSIEGDSGSAPGTFDAVIDLNNYTLDGVNGLLVGHSPSSTLSYGSATALLSTLFDSGLLENGTNTFALIWSQQPLVAGTDYDTHDNGTLEGLPAGAMVVDSVAFSDFGTGDVIYGGGSDIHVPQYALMLQASGAPDSATRVVGNTTLNSAAAWYSGELLGVSNTDVRYDMNSSSYSATLNGPGASFGSTTGIPSSASWSAGVVTITGIGFGFQPGETVTLNFYSSPAYNGTYILTDANSTTLTFNKAVDPGAYTANVRDNIVGTLYTAVTPVPSGASLTPGDANYAIPSSGVLSFGQFTYSKTEGNSGTTTMTVAVVRTGGTSGTVQVDYHTADILSGPGYATAGVDYVAANGTLTFGPGEVFKTFTITINGDATMESNEVFGLYLVPVGNAAVDSRSLAVSVNEAVATATATVDLSGAVTNINVTNGGAGYFNVLPQVVITGGGGSGAQAVANIDSNGVVTSITIISPGSGYTSAPTITLVGGTGSSTPYRYQTTGVILNDDGAAPNLVLNEIKIDMQSSDGPYEYIELRGTPNATLPSGTYVVSVEGDQGPLNAPLGQNKMGTFDYIFDLSGQTIGSNGLLIIRSSLGHAVIDPATTVVVDARLDGSSGILENGSNSFLVIYSPTTPLVAATSPGAGNYEAASDYDQDENGTLEQLPADAVIIDGIGASDGGGGDLTYGANLSVPVFDFAPISQATRLTNDTTPFSRDAWVYGENIFDNPQELTYDVTAGYNNVRTNALAGITTSTITNATWASGTATITAANSLSVGQTVTIAGMTPSAYNGRYRVLSASATDFTISIVSDPGAFVSGGTVTTSGRDLTPGGADIAINMDFGDAPDSYGTTVASFGPRHLAVGPTLGATRDAELDGQPGANADGDGADEDGITLPVTGTSNYTIGQVGASATANIQSLASGVTAYLNAWIDFNGDGDFNDAGEQIATDLAVVGTGSPINQGITFNVPGTAIAGATYARFRLTTDQWAGLSPYSANDAVAPDGEVEDYKLTIDTAPTITSNGGGATASVSVPENTTAVTTVTATDPEAPPQTLTYSIVGGADQLKFQIVGNALSFITAPDFETPTDVGGNNVYDVIVQVSDGNGGVDTQAIAVTVTDVAEGSTLDFGDAPDTYGTLLASNGARHTATGPMLGTLRDTEAEGQPSVNADGDGTDEDGVAFNTLYLRQTASVIGAVVTVSNAPSGAKLDAWIDFNGNGVFDVAEEIANDVSVVNGANNLSFAIPSTATLSATFARFRLSSAGGLGATGAAADGEVEDYKVTIQQTPVSGAPKINGDYAPISGASQSGSTVTFTTNGSHGFTAGNTVVIAGYAGGNAGYNGTFTIVSTPTANTFTVTNATAGLPTLTFNTQGFAVSKNTASAMQGTQRSMVDSVVYSFAVPVDLTTADFALSTFAPTTSGPATAATAAPNMVLTSLDGGSIWVMTWSSATGNTITGHSIADGVYDLSLTNSNRSSDRFYRLFGDTTPATGASRVNAADNGQFSLSWLKNTGDAGYNAAFDSNGDGRVNAADNGQFSLRWLSTWSGFTATI